MRGRGDIVRAVEHARIGRKARPQFHGDAAGRLVQIDGPQRAARVVEDVRTHRVGAVRHILHGATLVTASDELEAVARGPFRQRAEQAAGVRRSDGCGHGRRRAPAAGIRNEAQHQPRRCEAAHPVQVVQRKRGQRLEGHTADARLQDAEGGVQGEVLPRLVPRQLLEAATAAQMDAQALEAFDPGVHADPARLRPAQDARPDLLLGLCGQRPRARHGVQRRRAADLVQCPAERPRLAFDGGGLQKGNHFALGARAGPDLGQGGHGVAADLLGRILQQPHQPCPHVGLLAGGPGAGEGNTHGPNHGHACHPFAGRCAVEPGNLLAPKPVRRQGTQLPVEFLVGPHRHIPEATLPVNLTLNLPFMAALRQRPVDTGYTP
ncbi:MAG: hypothetical protein BWK77_09320 [Verrucomicrobia bacterium A1]|nr:MAG: hypothetical protein BWK77_09320 [Verrucomicrobia bacterium A1]